MFSMLIHFAGAKIVYLKVTGGIVILVLPCKIKCAILSRGQGLLKFNHFMQLSMIIYKQTASIVVANDPTTKV